MSFAEISCTERISLCAIKLSSTSTALSARNVVKDRQGICFLFSARRQALAQAGKKPMPDCCGHEQFSQHDGSWSNTHLTEAVLGGRNDRSAIIADLLPSDRVFVGLFNCFKNNIRIANMVCQQQDKSGVQLCAVFIWQTGMGIDQGFINIIAAQDIGCCVEPVVGMVFVFFHDCSP